MKSHRLATLWNNAIAFDLETHLIQPGLVAPPIVLGSAAEVGEHGPVGKLLDKTQVRALFKQIAESPSAVLGGANIAYDLLVLAVDAAGSSVDLMPLIFDMYDPTRSVIRGDVDGRVFEILLAEPLHAIANGHLGKHALTEKQFINPQTGRTGRYSLDTVTFEVTGREDAKTNDRFRLDYATFDGKPLADLPFEAAQYPVDDAKNTLEDMLGQAGLLPAVNVHEFIQGVQCRHCGHNAADPNTPLACVRKTPRRNLHDLSRQAYTAWALHLGAAWGFHVDQTMVDVLEAKIQTKLQDESAPFIAAGIIRDDGTENQAVLKQLVAKAYGAVGMCKTCLNAMNDRGKLMPPGKVPSPKTGNPINCEACDGTALELTASVPRSPAGGVKKDRDTLQESADDLLTTYGEQEGKKILSTYVPLMRKGRACLECGDTGAGKYPHKPWCQSQGAHGYRPIPLILRPNTLVETGRCSYEDGVHGLPRKGGVRECFRARPGTLLSSTDYQAGELVTLAEICFQLLGQSRLGDALNSGLDAHLALAGTMLGVSWEQIQAMFKSSDKAEKALAKDNRQAAKAANFGFPGGMAELTFVLRKRSDPDLFTPCANGPDMDKGIRGYKGMRPCILMGGFDRCGIVKTTNYNETPCPPVCVECLKNAKTLRGFWFDQWPEMNRKTGYFAKVNQLLERPTASGSSEIVHLFSNRVRGGVGFCDGANGLFQGLLSDAAKNAFCAIQRECWDRTIRVESSEMMTSRFSGGPSPLLGSRAIELAHDEAICEHPESVASDAAIRAGELMVEALRFACPHMHKAAKAEPALARFLAKSAEPIWLDAAKTQLGVWEAP